MVLDEDAADRKTEHHKCPAQEGGGNQHEDRHRNQGYKRITPDADKLREIQLYPRVRAGEPQQQLCGEGDADQQTVRQEGRQRDLGGRSRTMGGRSQTRTVCSYIRIKIVCPKTFLLSSLKEPPTNSQSVVRSAPGCASSVCPRFPVAERKMTAVVTIQKGP